MIFNISKTGYAALSAQMYPKIAKRHVSLKILVLSLCIVGGIAQSAMAQRSQRFKAGIIAGATASQIDGDLSAGYHKVGLQGGLKGIVLLKERQEASIEILFTQRGCRNEPKTPPFFNVTLQYIEVPLQWHYKDWLYEPANGGAEYYKVYFNAGVSVARLLGYTEKFDESGLNAALPHLNRTSVCGVLGATFFANRHVAFTGRYQRAFNLLYRAGKSGGNYQSSLNEHFLTFQAMYRF